MITYKEIHRRIKLILTRKMRVTRFSSSYTANFYDDLGFAPWELNWLLCNVEEYFNIEIEKGLEDKLFTVNQLVTVIYDKKQSQLNYKKKGGLNLKNRIQDQDLLFQI